jgi:HEAT repeat protein
MSTPPEAKKASLEEADMVDRALTVLKATPLQPVEAIPAIDALGESGDSRAVGPLIDLLKRSNDLAIKIHVCDALGRIGDPRAIDPLIEKLQDRDDDFYVRKKAAYTLYAIYRHGHLDQEQRDKIVSHWRSWYLL